PSVGTINIVDGATFGPYNKGATIHMTIAVQSNDSNESTESEPEFVTVTSAGGFSAKVNFSDTQNFGYTIQQNGETFSVQTADGDETGTIKITSDNPDIVVDSLSLNGDEHGVDIGFDVSAAPLKTASSIQLYWATGPDQAFILAPAGAPITVPAGSDYSSSG